MDQLTFWEKTFCEVYVSNGGKGPQAYQAARPEAAMSTCKTEACRTLQKPHIQARIEELRKKMVVSSFLTVAERRQFLADTVRANPRTVMDTQPHIAQAVTVTRRITDSGEVEEKVTVKLPDKLKALALDAAMAGELAPNQQGSGELAPVGNALDSLMGLVLTAPALPAPALPPPAQGVDEEDLL